MVTDGETGTRIDEVGNGIYRISTPISAEAIPPHGFSFNRYLIHDDEPMLFHAGLRKMFPLTRDAIATVMPPEKLRYIGISHMEADEVGALNELLAIAPHAEPVCGKIAAMVNIGDIADRQPRALADGDTLATGQRTWQWLDAPHMPHGWDAGYLVDTSGDALLCGDLFTQGGADTPPLTESDILGPSEDFRKGMDYYSHTRNAPALMEKIAATEPRLLACMHGSAWAGDGGALLRALGRELEESDPG